MKNSVLNCITSAIYVPFMEETNLRVLCHGVIRIQWMAFIFFVYNNNVKMLCVFNTGRLILIVD
jgi:hypothetical protein